MIVPDANLLIYAVDEDSPLHQRARSWLKSVLSNSEPVGFAWNVILAFLRLTTRAALSRNPLTLAAALEIATSWLEAPHAVVVEPGPRHIEVLGNLLLPLGTGGNLTSDAHLAAIAMEHGAVLYSCDNDFARFPRLKWKNPLQ